MPPSPALSDSLDITAELAEPTPAAVAPSNQHPSSAASGPPVSAVTTSEQSLKLDLLKSSSAATGTSLLRYVVCSVMTYVLSGQSFLVTSLMTLIFEHTVQEWAVVFWRPGLPISQEKLV